jgi:L-seryl-tRNA(Ser) seleniumtransferase
MSQKLRRIPPVHELLDLCRNEDWSVEFSHEQLLALIREHLENLRGQLTEDLRMPGKEDLVGQIGRRAAELRMFSLKNVINATGVIVHTNLGRAPISPAALLHLQKISEGYSNLEFDLTAGERGSRDKHLDEILRQLLPVEASLVVNNNAAALLLVLNSLAEGKEVIVSRGELVEIGGSFRLPDVMKKSGVILREVGTTNRTKTSDYRKAISDQTGMLLVVHPSNYQIVGFVERPPVEELVALGRQHNIPVVEDQGSGILTDLEKFGIPDEPLVAERLRTGLDLITFSGDKILGGPQAGLICGKRIWIDRCRSNPLFRALRVDKMIYAAMEGTLMEYVRNKHEQIPVIAMISQSREALAARAKDWIQTLQRTIPDHEFALETTLNYIGGGVAPMKALPSVAISLTPKKPAHEIARQLREADPPVVPRIENDRILFELRSIRPEQQELITAVLRRIL